MVKFPYRSSPHLTIQKKKEELKLYTTMKVCWVTSQVIMLFLESRSLFFEREKDENEEVILLPFDNYNFQEQEIGTAKP